LHSKQLYRSRILYATQNINFARVMATGNAWLQKQRKPDLADIADHLGLKKYATSILSLKSAFQ